MPGSNPYSMARTLVNAQARLIPTRCDQNAVYRMGDKHPPGLEGYAPTWEVVTVALGALQTQQMRVNVQRDFHLLALSGSASLAAGFRAQLYDLTRQRRLADRGVNWNNLCGKGGLAFFLREPYRLDLPDAQLLVVIQNLDASAGANTIQLAMYGVALRFNDIGYFPGGKYVSAASSAQPQGGL